MGAWVASVWEDFARKGHISFSESGREKLLGINLGEGSPVGRAVVAARFSVGISVFPDHGITSRELLGHADQALYIAKDRGRGRCAVFEGAR